MTPPTAYGHRRLVLRFEAYRQTRDGESLVDHVQAWLRTLPVSQQQTAKAALRRHLGRTVLDWGALELARYHRNEGTLAASVLRAGQRPRLRSACRGARELALIGVLYSLRRAEVCVMRWAHVDLSRGVVLVPRGKGGKSAWTLLLDSAQTDLGRWFEAAGSPPDDALVFPAPSGQPYRPGSLGRVVQKLLARAGLWHPGAGSAHRFRRTFATEYLRTHPGDLVGLQALLRHEQVSTTARYCFLQPDDLAPRLARVNL